MTLSLPPDKRYAIGVMLALAAEAAELPRSLPEKFVAKLAGKLSAAQLVVPRARSRCVSTHLALARAAHGAVDLRPARGDLLWWLAALSDSASSNQRLNLYPALASAHNTVSIFSDAAGDVGAGLVIGPPSAPAVATWHAWHPDDIDPAASGHTIQAKELFPLRAALQRYGTPLSGLIVVYYTDNSANAYGINSQKTSDASAAPILEDILRAADDCNILLIARWVPRELNTLCDDLSKSATAEEAGAHVPGLARVY